MILGENLLCCSDRAGGEEAGGVVDQVRVAVALGGGAAARENSRRLDYAVCRDGPQDILRQYVLQRRRLNLWVSCKYRSCLIRRVQAQPIVLPLYKLSAAEIAVTQPYLGGQVLDEEQGVADHRRRLGDRRERRLCDRALHAQSHTVLREMWVGLPAAASHKSASARAHRSSNAEDSKLRCISTMDARSHVGAREPRQCAALKV